MKRCYASKHLPALPKVVFKPQQLIFVETNEMEIMIFFSPSTCMCSDDIAVQILAVHSYLSDAPERCVSNIWRSCLMLSFTMVVTTEMLKQRTLCALPREATVTGFSVNESCITFHQR